MLAQNFTDLNALAEASQEKLMSIPGVGPKIAESVVAFFNQEDNKRIIRKLKEAWVWPKAKVVQTEALPLTGQEFVITGRLTAFSREDAEARVKALGGTAKDNVTKNTAYLVVGEEPGGSKLTRAQALGTKQMSEAEFLKMLGES